MIKFISFDLDDTLVDRESFDYVLWHQEIPKLYAKQYNISIGRATEIVFKGYYKLVDENKKGWSSPAYWFRKFKLKANYKVVLHDLSKRAKLFPEVKNVLEELSKKYKLVVLTKSGKEFIDLKLKVEGIRKYFDFVFSIDDFGSGKKGVYVYRRMLKKLNAKTTEVIHVGDDFQYDYKIPSKLGIKSIFLDRSGNAKSSRAIHNLKGLKRYLNAIKN